MATLLKNKAEVFAQKALSQLERILGLCDREPTSKTYGCCDRNYWHYRLLDLPNARLQEVCWFLAAHDQTSPKLIQWAQGMIDFWVAHQNSDGSVNEVYPFERSFCATSFSTLAVTESLLLQEDLHIDFDALLKTGRWLADHHNTPVFNQEAASLVALHNIAQLTGDKTISAQVTKRKSQLIMLQDASGYFPEYGGMDIGYLTISLGLLALYSEKTQDAEIIAACEKAARFLEPRINEDGRYDNNQTSRRTQYLYPYGLAVFAPNILARLQTGLEQNRVINPQWMDDRYCIALATDYLLTARKLAC